MGAISGSQEQGHTIQNLGFDCGSQKKVWIIILIEPLVCAKYCWTCSAGNSSLIPHPVPVVAFREVSVGLNVC